MYPATTLTFLGTGTSHGVPVIGCSCVVCTSSNTKDSRLRSSVLVETATTRLVIDTGPDFRMQMLREKVDWLDAALMTHEHRDHIAGLDDIRVFNYFKKGPFDLYCYPRVQSSIREAFSYVFQDSNYPGIPSVRFNDIDKDLFTIGDLEIEPIGVLHHRLEVCGFRFGAMAYLTDVSHIPEESMEKLNGLDHLVLGSLRKEEHISHFNLEQAVAAAERIGAKKTHLIHMSHDMGLHVEVEKELPDHIRLSYDGLKLFT